MSSTTTKPRTTKKFKALIAHLGSEEAAVNAWNSAFPDNPIAVELPEEVAVLVAAGFTEEQARAALGAKDAPKQEPVALTSKEQADVLVAKEGLTHVRGRVYTNPDLIEAQVRVLKTGKPEIVRTPGSHRTKAVAIWQTDEGSVAVQNLGEPA